MVYITSIPIIKPPIFRRRPIYTHQNGNINPTSHLPSNNLRATSMIGEVHEPLATLHSRALGSKLVMPSYMQIGLCPTRGMRGNSERNKFYCIVVCRASCKTRPIMRHYPTTCYPHNDFCLFCMCVRMYVCTYFYKYTHACVHLIIYACMCACT